MNDLTFLKLGGSAITDKTRAATPRPDVIHRLAREIKNAREQNPARGLLTTPYRNLRGLLTTPYRNLRGLLIGHGSGSFGHFTAREFGFGRPGPEGWHAYAETGASAARLNRIVTDIFLQENVPVVSFQPSASAICRDGEIVSLALEPIRAALAQDLVPLVFGDVAVDETRGMTIVSTEKIFIYLARHLAPTCIVLATVVDGVYEADPHVNPDACLIPEINSRNFAEIESRVTGSHGVDVTGGMWAKVKAMLALAEQHPNIEIRVISALCAGLVERALVEEDFAEGTRIAR